MKKHITIQLVKVETHASPRIQAKSLADANAQADKLNCQVAGRHDSEHTQDLNSTAILYTRNFGTEPIVIYPDFIGPFECPFFAVRGKPVVPSVYFIH